MQLIEIRDDQTRRQFPELPLAIYRSHPALVRPPGKHIEADFELPQNRSFH